MPERLIIARPHFFWTLPAGAWVEAQPGPNIDVKLVSPDGHHELVLGILVAPSEPAKAGARLAHLHESFLASNRELGECEVVGSYVDDEPGPTNNAGFELDFGVTVIRRKFFSVLAVPSLFGEKGRFQVLANVALYTQEPGRADGERRFDEALAGLSVAPGAAITAYGAHSAIDPATLLPAVVSRSRLDVFARLLQARGVDDPTRGLWPLGHDLFSLAVVPELEMPNARKMVLQHDAASLGLQIDDVIGRAFANIASRFAELVGRRLQTPGGQTVLVFHGNALNAAFVLHGMIQRSFAEQLGASQVLACFPRNDLVAVFADGTAAQREDARMFVLNGAGECDLSDRLFALNGTGGARAI